MSGADPLDTLGLTLRSGACELYVIRHGEAVPPVDGPVAFAAYEAQPLSARGEAQALAVAQRCAAANVVAVYTSPIRRARQTADAIAATGALAVQEDDDLREIALGGASDATMTLAERLAWFSLVAIRDGSWAAVPGTESSAAVRTRVLRALDAIAARHPGARVAVVSHAGAINAALGAIAQTANDFLFPLANTAVSIVRSGGGRRLIVTANDTAHLRALKANAASS